MREIKIEYQKNQKENLGKNSFIKQNDQKVLKRKNLGLKC